MSGIIDTIAGKRRASFSDMELFNWALYQLDPKVLPDVVRNAFEKATNCKNWPVVNELRYSRAEYLSRESIGKAIRDSIETGSAGKIFSATLFLEVGKIAHHQGSAKVQTYRPAYRPITDCIPS